MHQRCLFSIMENVTIMGPVGKYDQHNFLLSLLKWEKCLHTGSGGKMAKFRAHKFGQYFSKCTSGEKFFCILFLLTRHAPRSCTLQMGSLGRLQIVLNSTQFKWWWWWWWRGSTGQFLTTDDIEFLLKSNNLWNHPTKDQSPNTHCGKKHLELHTSWSVFLCEKYHVWNVIRLSQLTLFFPGWFSSWA